MHNNTLTATSPYLHLLPTLTLTLTQKILTLHSHNQTLRAYLHENSD